MAKNANEHWTDAELARAVDAYVFLLQAERSGLNIAGDAVVRLLLSGHLQSRNEVSIRYRMRNISAVVREMGGPTVSRYSPAEQVGSNVRRRLRAMLVSNAHLQLILKEYAAPAPPAREKDRTEALSQLGELRLQVSELERGIVGIGHNRPPEPLSADGLNRADFEHAREDISKLELQVESSQPDLEVVAEHSNRLLAFGAKVARWAGERATRVVDVTLALAAPILLAKALGLAPVIIDALAAVLRAVRFQAEGSSRQPLCHFPRTRRRCEAMSLLKFPRTNALI